MPPAHLILAAALSSPPVAAPAPAPAPAAPAPVVEVAPAPAPTATAPAPAAATVPAATPPPPSAAFTCPPPPPVEVKKGTVLIASGLALTGATYFFSALFGAIAIHKARKAAVPDNPLTPEDEARPTDRDRKRGQALMIPVVGPFLAMKHTPSVTNQFGNAFNGALQVTGVVLAIVGAVRQSRYNQAKRWGVAAAPGPEGARISFDVHF